MHDKYKRIVKKDTFGYRELSGKVVTKEKARELKKKKLKENNVLFPKASISKFRF